MERATGVGRATLKWVVRVILFIAISIAYLVWREAAAKFGYDGLIMAFYRGVALGVAFIVLWVWTNKIDGSHSKFRERKNEDDESPYFWALSTLIACISIGAGFISYLLVYFHLASKLIDPLLVSLGGIGAFCAVTVLAFIALFGLLEDARKARDPVWWDDVYPDRKRK